MWRVPRQVRRARRAKAGRSSPGYLLLEATPSPPVSVCDIIYTLAEAAKFPAVALAGEMILLWCAPGFQSEDTKTQWFLLH